MGVLILQMWFVWQALAIDPPSSSYLRADFTVEQGLPDDKVARFDGGHFTQIRLRPGIAKEIPVNFLLTAADGALWVGTDSGLVYIPAAAVDHFARSLVTMNHPGVGSSDRIACLLIRNGILWVGTSRGLYRCLSAFKPPA